MAPGPPAAPTTYRSSISATATATASWASWSTHAFCSFICPRPCAARMPARLMALARRVPVRFSCYYDVHDRAWLVHVRIRREVRARVLAQPLLRILVYLDFQRSIECSGVESALPAPPPATEVRAASIHFASRVNLHPSIRRPYEPNVCPFRVARPTCHAGSLRHMLRTGTLRAAGLILRGLRVSFRCHAHVHCPSASPRRSHRRTAEARDRTQSRSGRECRGCNRR